MAGLDVAGKDWSGRPDLNRRPLAPKIDENNPDNLPKVKLIHLLREISEYARYTKFPEFAQFINLLVAFWSQNFDGEVLKARNTGDEE